MDTGKLKQWAKEHNIETRAKESFWNYMNAFRKEEPEQFEKEFGQYNWDKIEVAYAQISMSVSYLYDDPLDFVAVYLDIYEADEDDDRIYIGVYKCFFSFDGECFDDSFMG